MKKTHKKGRFHKVLLSGCLFGRVFQLAALALGSLVILWGGSYYYTHYLQTIPAGVSLHGVQFSGLNRREAQGFLEKLVAEWEKKPLEVVLSRNGIPFQKKTFLVREFGLQYDANLLVSSLFDSSFLQADVLQTHGAADMTDFFVGIDKKAWKNTLQSIRTFEQPVKDASLLYDRSSSEWILNDDQQGLTFLKQDEARLKDQLLEMAHSGFPQSPLEVIFEREDPSVTTEDLQPLYDKVQFLLEKKYEWKVDGETVGFSLAENPEVIRVDMERRAVAIDPDFLHAFLSEWAKSFNRDAGKVIAQKPSLQEKGYLKSDYEGTFLSGRMLDEEEMMLQILSGSASQEKVQELPFIHTTSDVELLDEGKLTLLSQGRSSYALAHGEDREFNVRFGLSKYDGIVIPKGAEFNFNQILGWVTYEAGWKPALAIFGGGGVKPVPGGGLCQVSTTMYRAVINSGLPVTARKPHSLDVNYYQQYGYGIDSTVYPPEDINLKFVNDTPGAILIHTFLDEVNKEVFIEFYGVDDGREVEIKQVVNREVKLPSEISSTSEIPTGMQEVLQKGRTGRYIEWEWNVKKADGSVENRLIKTLYPAAARVVRVGNG